MVENPNPNKADYSGQTVDTSTTKYDEHDYFLLLFSIITSAFSAKTSLMVVQKM